MKKGQYKKCRSNQELQFERLTPCEKKFWKGFLNRSFRRRVEEIAEFRKRDCQEVPLM